MGMILSKLPVSLLNVHFLSVEMICLHNGAFPTSQPVLFFPAHPQPQGLGFALSPKEEESRPTKRKVHRLFNGVMATSLPRPDLMMTVASRVLGRQWTDAGWVEAMQ